MTDFDYLYLGIGGKGGAPLSLGNDPALLGYVFGLGM